MLKFMSSRTSRLAAGLVVASAFAAVAVPVAAQAATTDADGTLAAGPLSNTAPDITPFTATLSGVTQTVNTAVGAWGVTDATGSNAGYSVTVSATPPTVAGSTGPGGGAGTGASITLTPTAAAAGDGNPAPAADAPVAEAAQPLGTTAVTIDNAVVGTGQGDWDYAADNGTNVKDLAVVIPGDASAGAYSSTLTFTTAAPSES